jgi:hypothetical protein
MRTGLLAQLRYASKRQVSRTAFARNSLFDARKVLSRRLVRHDQPACTSNSDRHSSKKQAITTPSDTARERPPACLRTSCMNNHLSIANSFAPQLVIEKQNELQTLCDELLPKIILGKQSLQQQSSGATEVFWLLAQNSSRRTSNIIQVYM